MARHFTSQKSRTLRSKPRCVDLKLAIVSFPSLNQINNLRGLQVIGSYHGLHSSSTMPFGEIVCGSPGSGKSTYCFGKYQLFTALNRPISIVNLDPANDALPYPCAIDISSLVTLGDVMDKHGLGPNGGLLYCMEYLEANFDWLEGRLKELGDDAYVLFDLPGQVELSTNHESIKRILKRLTKNAFRVCLNIFPLTLFRVVFILEFFN